MKFKDWNYKGMGFNSETEMKESIARVERKMKMSSFDLEVERRREAQNDINEGGGINFTALNEGARLDELDLVVHNQILHDKEQAKRQAEQAEMQSLFKATAEHVTAENEATAQREMQKEKEKFEADRQREIYSKHGVKTDKEKELDEAYAKLLGN